LITYQIYKIDNSGAIDINAHRFNCTFYNVSI